MKKLLCKILTFGRHWWTYGSNMRTRRILGHVHCRICDFVPGNQWETYEEKFKGKKSGKASKKITHKFRKRIKKRKIKVRRKR